MFFHNYSRRLRIWETDFGRTAGWIVEYQGQPVAILTEPREEEMFWDSYRLEIVTDDLELRERLLTEEFWLKECVNLVWRNREFGEVAEAAFAAGDPFPEPGRLTMRGLYLWIGWPWPWDRVVLWVRRWWRKWRARKFLV